jgi:peptide/nickel transport system permease protein
VGLVARPQTIGARGHPVLTHLLTRIAQALLTLWLILTLTFVGINLAGDPISLLVSDSATAQERLALEQSLGLNAAPLERYGRYLMAAATGNLGVSFVFDRPALPLLLERLPVTLLLVAVSLTLSLLLGVPLGVIAAARHGSSLERVILTGSAIAVSAPTFFIGIVLIFVFAVQWRVLPSQGASDWTHFILPTLTLSIPRIALFTRYIRAGLLEVLPEDFIRTARAKGLPMSAVLYGHGLRNALLPFITVLGLQLGGLLSGTVITETLFALPGINRLALEGLTRLDYPLILAYTLISSGTVLTLNLLTDALYGLVDPRVRYG